jgi:hypothetical protein
LELSEVLNGAVVFTFEKDDVPLSHWSEFMFDEMSPEQQTEAQEAWRESRDACEPEDAPGLPSTNPGASDSEQLAKMSRYMRRDLRWSRRDLHDAVRHLGFTAPRTPSMIEYFKLLHAAIGDSGAAFAPQNARTHTKDRLSKCLRSLARGGAKLGGSSGSKSVIAQRLATVLGWVCDAGCEYVDEDSEAEGHGSFQCGHKPSRILVPVARPIAEVPADAVIDAVQAESALGHLAATEFDEDCADGVDKDLRAEEEALIGRHVNPKGIDYSCLADADASGWHPPLVPHRLSRQDFNVTLERMQQRFRDSHDELRRACELSTMSPEAKAMLDAQVAGLDPTQLQVYDILNTWAEQRLAWRQRKIWTEPPPSLRLLLLGTAGTGKTHTAKTAISRVRHSLGSFSSVATVAHTGVAAANLGGGAVTINSCFKLTVEARLA